VGEKEMTEKGSDVNYNGYALVMDKAKGRVFMQ